MRLLDASWLREIGLVSYGAYLFHPVIRVDHLLATLGLQLELTRSTSMVIELTVTLILAELSWRLLERPVRRCVAARA